MNILSNMLASVNMVFTLLLAPLVNFLVALALLLIGWIVAKFLQWLVAYVLKAVRLDKGCQSIGLTPLLTKGEIKKSPSDLLGDLVYWVAILVTVIATANYLGLRIATKMLMAVLAYLPSVLSAAIVLGAAMFLGSLIYGLVLLVANNVGLSGTKPLARIAYYAVVFFGFIVALQQLGVFQLKLDYIIWPVGLAAAIAFGLGSKDMAGDFITNLFKQR